MPTTRIAPMLAVREGARAVAAGAPAVSPVTEHRHEMTGPRPIKRMQQGKVLDPFGHHWLIGRIET